MNAHKQVRAHLACNGNASAETDEVVRVSRENRFHVRLGVNKLGKTSCDLQDDRFFHRFSTTDRARVFAPVSGVNDDDDSLVALACGLLGRLGGFFRRFLTVCRAARRGATARCKVGKDARKRVASGVVRCILIRIHPRENAAHCIGRVFRVDVENQYGAGSWQRV